MRIITTIRFWAFMPMCQPKSRGAIRNREVRGPFIARSSPRGKLTALPPVRGLTLPLRSLALWPLSLGAGCPPPRLDDNCAADL